MKIVLLGGGTGTSVVINALKRFSEFELSVIVSMMDDGGSNAVVRDVFGMLPLSDLRKSIIAMSDADSDAILRQIFLYRFDKGDGLEGHTLGNLIMMGLTEITGSEEKAIEELKNIFRIRGNIIPVTLNNTRLKAIYNDNSVINGEHYIDESNNDSGIKQLKLTKNVKANPRAIEVIEEAEYIITGPGDLYTTIIPNLLVKGMKEAIKKSNAKIVYIGNLMIKKGETCGKTQSQIVKELEKYLGKKIDYVLLNNGEINRETIEIYEKDHQHRLVDDFEVQVNSKPIVLNRDLVNNTFVKKDKGDKINRSLIRHDAEKLSVELYSILRGGILRSLSNMIFGSINN